MSRFLSRSLTLIACGAIGLLAAPTQAAPSRLNVQRFGLTTRFGQLALAQQSVSAGVSELQTRLNAFCVDFWKSHNNESQEFFDAYREAYELLQIAKKMNSSLAAGGSESSLKSQIQAIDSELHHVELHLKEFADRDGVDASARERLASKLESVEEQVGALKRQLGIKGGGAGHDDHDHEHGQPAKGSNGVIDWDRAIPAAAEVQKQTSSLSTQLYKSFNNESEEFLEGYRESYELMLKAKKLHGQLKTRTNAPATRELMQQLSEAAHHAEEHIAKVIESQEVSSEKARATIEGQLKQLEESIHELSELLSGGGGNEAHDHEETEQEVAAKAKSATTSELAVEMSTAALSLSRAIEHNYKQNPDFGEAYNESREFYEICAAIAKGVRDDSITAEARGLISGLDREIHHLEEHINGFKRDDTNARETYGRSKRKLAEVQLALHAIMKRSGIRAPSHLEPSAAPSKPNVEPAPASSSASIPRPPAPTLPVRPRTKPSP